MFENGFPRFIGLALESGWMTGTIFFQIPPTFSQLSEMLEKQTSVFHFR